MCHEVNNFSPIAAAPNLIYNVMYTLLFVLDFNVTQVLNFGLSPEG